MRAYYHPAGAAHRCGIADRGHVEHWDALWSATAFDEAYRASEHHFLAPVFARYFPTSGKILEAGCGLGQYVARYRARGYDIEGVDTSTAGIEKAKARDPSLPLAVADIRRLPHADGSIAVYFSGGVIEHFEEGPWDALAEARRVLRDDGRLIVTVPFMNLARACQDLLPWRISKEFAPVRGFDERPPAPDGREFYQYAFTRREITGVLRRAGFEPIEARGAQIVWGLKKLFDRQPRAGSAGPPRNGGASGAAPPGWKRVWLVEDSRNPLVRAGLRVLGEAAGHMILLVCRKA